MFTLIWLMASVFEGDDETYTFCAKTEEERDSWIQSLHTASYECLKMQLQSLREQVQSKTGQDPLVNMIQSDTGMEFETRVVNDSSEPAMEISLCELSYIYSIGSYMH